jgi:prepilin-type N-terminal cleavage/methylation domain-containing protein
MDRLRKRLAREEGFTLIELLIVIVIIGILLAIAVPSYLGFRDRANQKAANSDVRAAVPAAEAYFADNGTYNAMDTASLRSIDTGVDIDNIVVSTATGSVTGPPATTGRVAGDTYCVDKTVGGKNARAIRGKGAQAGATGSLGSVKEGALCPGASTF